MEKKLGQTLKEYRERAFKGEGLRRVADEAGLNYSYLYRVEEGTHVPSDELLFKLAEVYKLSLKEKLELVMMAHSPELQNLLSEASSSNPDLMKAVFYRKGKKK